MKLWGECHYITFFVKNLCGSTGNHIRYKKLYNVGKFLGHIDTAFHFWFCWKYLVQNIPDQFFISPNVQNEFFHLLVPGIMFDLIPDQTGVSYQKQISEVVKYLEVGFEKKHILWRNIFYMDINIFYWYKT